jgi:acetolactate synthase small subunit
MTTRSPHSHRRQLWCQLQERHGALDRLVGALSHRGLSILAMHGEMDAEGQVFTATFEFDCADDHEIEKLIKALEKQITVLQASCVTLGEDQPGFTTIPASPIRCA